LLRILKELNMFKQKLEEVANLWFRHKLCRDLEREALQAQQELKKLLDRVNDALRSGDFSKLKPYGICGNADVGRVVGSLWSYDICPVPAPGDTSAVEGADDKVKAARRGNAYMAALKTGKPEAFWSGEYGANRIAVLQDAILTLAARVLPELQKRCEAARKAYEQSPWYLRLFVEWKFRHAL